MSNNYSLDVKDIAEREGRDQDDFARNSQDDGVVNSVVRSIKDGFRKYDVFCFSDGTAILKAETSDVIRVAGHVVPADVEQGEIVNENPKMHTITNGQGAKAIVVEDLKNLNGVSDVKDAPVSFVNKQGDTKIRLNHVVAKLTTVIKNRLAREAYNKSFKDGDELFISLRENGVGGCDDDGLGLQYSDYQLPHDLERMKFLEDLQKAVHSNLDNEFLSGAQKFVFKVSILGDDLIVQVFTPNLGDHFYKFSKLAREKFDGLVNGAQIFLGQFAEQNGRLFRLLTEKVKTFIESDVGKDRTVKTK